MKPFLEKVASEPEASWSLLHRRLEGGIPFEWHHHPEFELTLTLNSRGQRFVGDHIGQYGDGDLVLLGPHLPHTWASSARIDPATPHVAFVMWFRPDWADKLTSLLTEWRPVSDMLARASRGLKFSPEVAAAIRPEIENLFGLPPSQRLLALFAVLTRLAADETPEPLAGPLHGAVTTVGGDSGRIDRVLAHLHAHYAEELRLEDLADLAALSPSGFHRMFRRHTRLSLTDYLARLRVGAACALLAGSDLPVAHVATDVGYRNLSHFNRQFRTAKGMTPRQYRTRFAA